MAIDLLHYVRIGDQITAKRILQQRTYSSIDKQTDRNDGTSLFWACCQGFIELVHLLILHGADINKRTSWGSTPLHASVDNNHVDIVKLLLRFGAQVNLQTDVGDTPCHLASYRGHGECVQTLAEHGADVTLANNKHHTPIDEALGKGHFEISNYLLAVKELVKGSGKSRSNSHPSFTPVWASLNNSVSCQSLPCSPDKTSEDSSTLTDNGHPVGAVKQQFVGVLRLQDCSYLRGETSSSISYHNDLSSTSSISPPMSFRNIP